MREIEMYRLFSDKTWDTVFISIRKNTPDNMIDTVAQSVAVNLWPELIAVGVYNIPPLEY